MIEKFQNSIKEIKDAAELLREKGRVLLVAGLIELFDKYPDITLNVVRGELSYFANLEYIESVSTKLAKEDVQKIKIFLNGIVCHELESRIGYDIEKVNKGNLKEFINFFGVDGNKVIAEHERGKLLRHKEATKATTKVKSL